MKNCFACFLASRLSKLNLLEKLIIIAANDIFTCCKQFYINAWCVYSVIIGIDRFLYLDRFIPTFIYVYVL